MFLDRARLKIDVTSKVIYASELLFTIQLQTEPHLTPHEVEMITHVITSQNNRDQQARKEHVHQIRQDLQAQSLKVAELICPRCEGELVERKGKYGTFLGCSNYPKCRFVVKEGKVSRG